MKTSLILLSIQGAMAALHLPALMVRQLDSCAANGYQECGIGCIGIGWECCPSLDRGCDIGTYCVLGDNDEYGCCPLGEICSGNGGVSTQTIGITSTLDVTQTFTLTSEPTDVETLPLPSETETVSIPSISVPELTTSDVLPIPSSSFVTETVSDTVTVSVSDTVTSIPSSASATSVASGTSEPEPTPVPGAAALNGVSGLGLIAGVLAGAVVLLL